MAAVTIYELERRDLGLSLPRRGHHVVYRANETNRCPGCGRAHWYVGRQTAECGFCGTALALAETSWKESGPSGRYRDPGKPFGYAPSADAFAPASGIAGSERREHERLDVAGRTLQLLIDGSPHSFALENISAGGLKGALAASLAPEATVHVRFEGGILVPAEVRWVERGLVGLAFATPVMLDNGRS